MSRKDPRRALNLTPDSEVWAALLAKRQAGRSIADVARRALIGADLAQARPRPQGKGQTLSLQLPKATINSLNDDLHRAERIHGALAEKLLDQDD